MPTDAYQEAYGCSNRIANVNAYRLLENDSIKESIEEFKKREEERIAKRLDRLVTKAVDNVESALNLDENDTSLNFFKMMAIQHKTKTAENHLKRMGFDSPIEHKHSGSLDLNWKEIIYGTADKDNDDSETESN